VIGAEWDEIRADLARDIVRVQPDPPRRVFRWRVRRRVFQSRDGAAVIAAAAACLAGGSLLLALLDNLAVAAGLALICYGLGGFFLLAPVLESRQALRALRHGVLAEAAVISCEGFSRKLSGRAESIRGRLEVADSQKDYEMSFESSAPWAFEAKPGTRLRVLFDPDEGSLLANLGPADDHERYATSPPTALQDS
jgi:hypothetical protein